MNFFKTFLLMFGLLVLMMLIGQVLGDTQGMFLFFLIGLGMNFVSYWFSDKIVLKMQGAKETQESDLPQVHRIVRQLTLKAELPMPKIYLVKTALPNAFATGRNPNHAAVAVTTGILDILDENELTGVLGHELAHVKNRDILISTIAAAIAGAVMMASRFSFFFRGGGQQRSNIFVTLIAMMVAPLAATIIQMAISRSREFGADKTGSQISGMPLALAGALQKLESGVKKNPTEVSLATAHLFIISPLTAKSLGKLFSSHPSTAERVQRLEQIASEQRIELSR